MSWRWRLLLLLLLVWVTTATSVTQCDSDKYELKSLGLCCQLCPPGEYVSKHCDETRPTECSHCEHGTFTAHHNSETSCLPCTPCREDQEVVTSCSATRNQQCQCQRGSYYCDSGDCVEGCFRCTRCKGATLHACNATADAICAAETNPVPGHAHIGWDIFKALEVLVVGIGFIGIIVFIVFIVRKCCCKRRVGAIPEKNGSVTPLGAPGVQLLQQLVHFMKRESSEPGSHSCSSGLPNEMLPLTDPERPPTALGVNSLLLEEGSALASETGTRPGPSEDPEVGSELLVMVGEGSDTAPEQTLQAPAPAAGGPQGRAEASASLSQLQQEYKREYYLKDRSSDATNRIYYEFGHKVPESHWKMLMRFIGLADNDIEICKHENPGNLMEQHHKMLLRWRNKLGREASVFKLLAALHQMELYVYLQNIVNKLVADNILGRHAETPN